MENIGIYKWVSPTNRVYVGQTKNLKQRQEWYNSNGIDSARMPKLKRSFGKYGIDNHTFSIIEYCTIEQLNEREIYWGLYYNTLEEGLNCKLGEQNCIFSKETKLKMSLAKQGCKLSPKSEAKRQASLRKVWDEKNRIREEKKQNKPKYKFTENHLKNLSKSKIGKPIHTPESKQKLRDYGKTRNLTKAWEAAKTTLSKPVIQYSPEGKFIKKWPSAQSAEKSIRGKGGDNINSTIRHFKKTGNQRKAYGYIWKSQK